MNFLFFEFVKEIIKNLLLLYFGIKNQLNKYNSYNYQYSLLNCLNLYAY